MSTLQAVFLIVGLAAMTIIGDYFLKLASLNNRSYYTVWFMAGAAMYALSAFGWVLAMQYLKLATIGVIYSISTVLLLTILGVMMFGEILNKHEVAGIVFAILAIFLLCRFNN